MIQLISIPLVETHNMCLPPPTRVNTGGFFFLSPDNIVKPTYSPIDLAVASITSRLNDPLTVIYDLSKWFNNNPHPVGESLVYVIIEDGEQIISLNICSVRVNKKYFKLVQKNAPFTLRS